MNKKEFEKFQTLQRLKRDVGHLMKCVEQINEIPYALLPDSDKYLLNVYQKDIDTLNGLIKLMEKKGSKKK